MASFQAFPPTGRTLPKGWEAEAARNAADAAANYQATVCQQWRQPMQGDAGLMQAARLRQQPSSQPPSPKRSDSRSDTRMDGMMTLIRDDSFEQVWKDATGAIVTIRKQRK